MKVVLTMLALTTIPLLAACGSELPDACFQLPETGDCKASISRYYFDADAGVCREFLWGGCGGSVPFEALKACQQACE